MKSKRSRPLRQQRPSWVEKEKPVITVVPTPPPLLVHPVEIAPVMVSTPVFPVRKVQDSDIDDLMTWFLPRWKMAWPNASDEGLSSIIRGAITDRYKLFLRSDNVAAMFEIVRTPWEPSGIVREIVMRRRTDYHQDDEAIAVYLHALIWSRSIKALDFQVGFDTDARIHNAGDIKSVMVRIGATSRMVVNGIKP